MNGPKNDNTDGEKQVACFEQLLLFDGALRHCGFLLVSERRRYMYCAGSYDYGDEVSGAEAPSSVSLSVSESNGAIINRRPLAGVFCFQSRQNVH